jgi:vacuolar-type H+-ATPase subunit I/STV1
MPEYKPLTKEERGFFVRGAEVFSRRDNPDPTDEIILRYEATVAELEATLDGYRAKGGAFFEDGFSYEAKMRAEAEARVQELEAEAATRKESIDRLHQTALDVMRERDEARAEAEAKVAELEAETVMLEPMRQQLRNLRQRMAGLDARVKSLEDENARLTPLAEVGKAVEGMAVGDALGPTSETTWQLTHIKGGRLEASEGPTALAALRAAKGEGDG